MKQYVVDAFTDEVFGGNPAAVCVMENWLSEDVYKRQHHHYEAGLLRVIVSDTCT